MAKSFVGMIRFRLPSWILEGDGFAVARAFARLVDESLARDRASLEVRLPSYIVNDADALDMLGYDRGLLRGRTETGEHFAARLQAWRYPRGHRVRGNAFALLDQISEYFGGIACATIDRRGNHSVRAEDGSETCTHGNVWDWDGAPVSPRWARFWTILEGGETIEIRPDWSGDLTVGTLGLLGVELGDVAAIRGLTAGNGLLWKPGGTRPEWMIVVPDGEAQPAPAGLWGTWHKVVAGVASAARDPALRYVSLSPTRNNVYAGNPESFPTSAPLVLGVLASGNPASFPTFVRMPSGAYYGGNPASFPATAQLVDDGAPAYAVVHATTAEALAFVMGSDLPGALDGWWSAAWPEYLTLVSGAVSQADDLSGNARHATQATAALRPDVVSGAFRGAEDSGQSLMLPAAIAGLFTGTDVPSVVVVDVTSGGDTRKPWAPLLISAESTSHVDVPVEIEHLQIHSRRGADGVTWAEPTAYGTRYPKMFQHSAVACAGVVTLCTGQVFGLGVQKQIWRSTDGGINFTQAADGPWPAEGSAAMVRAANGRLILAGGSVDGDDVYASDDNGATWSLLAETPGFAARQLHSMVNVNGRIIIGQGYNGIRTIWKSDDHGATWSQLAATGGLDAVYGQSLTVLGGKVYAIGGMNGTTPRANVWVSADGGATFTLVTSTPGWVARFSHCAWAADGRLWIAGGEGSAGRKNDVWFWDPLSGSTAWVQATAAATWPARAYAASAIVNGRPMVLGGLGVDWYQGVWQPSVGHLSGVSLSTGRQALVIASEGTTRTIFRNGAQIASGACSGGALSFAGSTLARILSGQGEGRVSSLAIFTPKSGQTIAQVTTEALAFSRRFAALNP